jgi:transcriptional regulator with XRE-family HTH domain
MKTRLQVQAARRAAEIARVIGSDLRVLREDAGATQAEVARVAGLSRQMVSRTESGAVRPSIETMTAMSSALGADLSIKVYPGAGVPIRDRFQARMVEALLRTLHPRWRAHLEVPIHRPARGVIDVVLEDLPLLVATEAQSDLRRLEAQIRWHAEKASGLPHTPLALGAGGTTVSVSRLLLLRSTRRMRELAREFEHVLRAAYPARTVDALDSLIRGAPWPGPAVVWVAVDGRTAIVLARGPRGVTLGR